MYTLFSQIFSDIENIHETIDILRKRIRELENKENDSNNNDSTCYICSVLIFDLIFILIFLIFRFIFNNDFCI
jgi:hypothetical protein